jgi:hypothetical protein
MTRQSQIIAGILLVAVPTIQIGGYSLLRLVTGREHGWEDNQLRRSLWRAGHAHAGVWVLLALVVLLYVDQVLTGLPATIVRTSVAFSPILGPLGFFLSVSRPDAERPTGLINLVYAGAALLALGVVILGIALLIG